MEDENGLLLLLPPPNGVPEPPELEDTPAPSPINELLVLPPQKGDALPRPKGDGAVA